MPLDSTRLLKPVKKLRKLVKNIGKEPVPGEVHELRTNTRRFEAVFGALSRVERKIDKSVLKTLTRLRKRAGKVRDMDVLTGYASTVHPQGEDDCTVQLLEHLGARRRKEAKKLYREVRRLRPALRKDLKVTSATLDRLIRENGNGRREREASAQAAATAVKLATELSFPQHLSRETLHPYRLKVKELRNVLQIAAGESSPKLLDDLKRVKDEIGEWHDWQVLVSIAQKLPKHRGRCELLVELKRITSDKYESALLLAQSLRKRYLRNSRSPKKGSAATSSATPREPVLEAIAMLAG